MAEEYGVGVVGIGFYVPPRVVTNLDIVSSGIDTTEAWIESRTGIKERRVVDAGVSTSDIAYEAAVKALNSASLDSSQLDLIIVATSTPDFPLFPSTGCLLQSRLGATQAAAFDVSAACSGFSYALTTAEQYVQTGYSQNVLVVGADCLSKYIDWTDRGICVLFGDGAGAVVVSRVKPAYGILYSKLYANGAYADILMVPSGGSRTPISVEVLAAKSNLIFMNGPAVFKVAVGCLVPSILEALLVSGIQLPEIKWFVPHQANVRIIDLVVEKLGLDPECVVVNLDRYGNTSAASIPIAMAEGANSGQFKEGDIILTIGFGAGFTWGVHLIRWGGLLTIGEKDA